MESSGRWSSGVGAGGEEQQWISGPESGMSRLEDGVSRGPVDEGAVVATQWQVDQCRTRGSGKGTGDKWVSGISGRTSGSVSGRRISGRASGSDSGSAGGSVDQCFGTWISGSWISGGGQQWQHNQWQQQQQAATGAVAGRSSDGSASSSDGVRQ